MFNELGRNCFEFEELEWKIEEGIAGFFKSSYQGFLKVAPVIEAIWQERKKKLKIIIADIFATYALYLAKKHAIPLIVFYSTYFVKKCIGEMQESISKELTIIIDESSIPLQKQVEENCCLKIEYFINFLIEGDYNISCLPKFVGELVTVKIDKFMYFGPGFRDQDASEKIEIDPAFMKDNDIIYVCLGASIPNIKGFFSL